MKTTAALLEPEEPQVWSNLVAVDVEAWLYSVTKQAARDRVDAEIAKLEAAWKLS
jgi:hypothetical protein